MTNDAAYDIMQLLHEVCTAMIYREKLNLNRTIQVEERGQFMTDGHTGMTIDERRRGAFHFLYDYSFGTLWIVREDVIKMRADSYDEKSTRKGHPHVSIQRKNIESLEMVPMLIGTSKKHSDGFRVSGVMGDSSKITWFGMMVPYSYDDFLGRGSDRPIQKNGYRDSLTDDEQNGLAEWLEERGV